MIQINQLYITQDSKHLVIDAQIIDSDMYKNVTFDYIAIDNQNTYIKDSISENAIKITEEVKGKKHIYITKDIDIDNPMLFVYFVADASKGIIPPSGMTDIPCTWDETVMLEVICAMNNVFTKALEYIREMADNCNTPKGMIDFILQYNILKASLGCGAYNEAIKWWKKITDKTKVTVYKSCGCNG